MNWPTRPHVRRQDITQEMVLSHFHYCTETGVLRWKISVSNLAQAGTLAGTLNGQGYLTVTIFKTAYQVHRLVWFMLYGEWPQQIDHINGRRDDNRLENLRPATNAQNQINSPAKGYCFDRAANRFKARTTLNGKRIHLGSFRTEQEAQEAFLRGHAKIHGDFSFTQRSEHCDG